MKKKLILFILLPLAPLMIAAESLYTNEQNGSKQKKSSYEKSASKIDLDIDYGKKPWAFDIEAATLDNENYRSANWTGDYMQLVFMSLKPGEVINLEVHEDHDQFIRIEQGKATVWMGKTEDDLSYKKEVKDDWAIMIPAGYWHKIKNAGDVDLKLYTLYGPPEHPKGTSNKTYEKAKEAHEHNH
ncbi:cupin domain-containing protein [Marinilabiliaceae bacterium ANBcel2]|nr:cupin domain-containing protein [Marinilabiliaceae bacterium ANBcel2]